MVNSTLERLLLDDSQHLHKQYQNPRESDYQILDGRRGRKVIDNTIHFLLDKNTT